MADLKLNLIPSGVMPVAYINQYDFGIQRTFEIYKGSEVYAIPTGYSVTLRATKPDGYGIATAGSYTAGQNVVTVTIPQQLTAVSGKAICELVFVNASNVRVGTINFVLSIEAAALSENTVISDSDIAYAEEVLDQLQSVQALGNQVAQNTAAISAEAVTRAAAVTSLQAADTALQNAISAETGARTAADTQLSGQIAALQGAVGAPQVAATAAAMTDTSKIYVYTGSESGMTSGNWYYYNGSSWVSGGVYNAIAINTDTTLSVAGMAADAKAAGDEITDLKSHLEDVTGNIMYSLIYGGYIATDGATADITSIVSNGAYSYAIIDCVEGDAFTLTGKGATTQRLYAFLGAESGGTRPVLEKATAQYQADMELIEAPANAQKLVINALNAYPSFVCGGEAIVKVWDALEESEATLRTEMGYITHGNPSVTGEFATTDGYYVSTGSATLGGLNSDANSYATSYIRVQPGSAILARNCYLYGARGICAYKEDKTVISALTTNSGTTSTSDAVILIPGNAAYIRASGKIASGQCSFEYLSIVVPGSESISPEYTDISASATDGKYVSGTSGGTPNDSGACASAFIRVRPYAHIMASGLYLTGARSVSGYDKNHTFIRAIATNSSDTAYEFDVDPDVYYIRATGRVGVPPTIKTSLPDVDDTKRLFTDVSILIPYDRRDAVCRKIVTYVDDDALDEPGLDLLKESCDTLGIKCSIAAIGKILEANPSRVTYLKGLELEGFHICNHSYDHSRWYEDYEGTMFTLAEVEQDLIKSIRLFDSLGFIDASRFLIYPGSSYNRAGITAITKKWTELACTISAGNNRIENVPRSWLYRCPINSLSHADLTYYQDQLENLTVENANNWIIYYSHSKTWDESGEWSQTLFEGVMQNALDNGYTAMTLNEAWRYRKAMWLAQEAFGL